MKAIKTTILSIILLLLGLPTGVAAQEVQLDGGGSGTHRMLAVKSNALFLAATVFNVGMEVGFAPDWSLDIPLYYSPYDISSTRKLRTLAVQPEVRWWTDTAGQGLFLGVHMHFAGFNIAVNDHGRYQDDERPLWGMGVGGGYAFCLDKNKRWSLELNLGVGFASYSYDVFCNTPGGQKKGSGKDCHWGVTRAGVTFAYRWQLPHKERRGAWRH